MKGHIGQILHVDMLLLFGLLTHYHSSLYVTGFGKLCIVHTSNFSTFVTHKIYLEWQINLKLSGIVEPLFLYDTWKFQFCRPFCRPFSVVFMDLPMGKIECMKYAYFPKSGHIFKTKILNLKGSRDWSLLQNVREQGACSSYSYSEMI